MIERKFFSGSAILAFKIVALENVLAGKRNAFVRSIHIPIEPDYRWHRVRHRYGVNLIPVCRANHFAFVEIHEDKGTLNRTDHERAKILI